MLSAATPSPAASPSHKGGDPLGGSPSQAGSACLRQLLGSSYWDVPSAVQEIGVDTSAPTGLSSLSHRSEGVCASVSHPSNTGRIHRDSASMIVTQPPPIKLASPATSGTCALQKTSHTREDIAKPKPVAAKKGAGKGKAPPPPPRPPHAEVPPPPGNLPSSTQQATMSKANLPGWLGPAPSGSWKSERVVNWQPIRHSNRWEGSVWQQVHGNMKQGFDPLPDDLLNQAFMRKGSAASQPRRRKASQRRLSGRAALATDLLHQRLQRLGIHKADQLRWIVGGRGEKSRVDEDPELSEEVLETLSGLLQAAAAEESKLLAPDTGTKAEDSAPLEAPPPAEKFLVDLASKVAPLSVMRPSVETALQLAQFPAKASALDWEMRLGICASRAVLDSSCVPILLEGVLLLGNYVNSASKSLGGAVGVTLESLAKLAHTRCLSSGSKGGRPGAERADNALHLLVRHLEKKRPNFALMLAEDLDACIRARDLDPKTSADGVRCLEKQLETLATVLQPAEADDDSELASGALAPTRLRAFLAQAKPRVERLRMLVGELEDTTEALRRYFAEPPITALPDMMRCLAELRRALPQVHPEGLPPYPRPCHLRKVEQGGASRSRQLEETCTATFQEAIAEGLRARARSWSPRHCGDSLGDKAFAVSRSTSCPAGPRVFARTSQDLDMLSPTSDRSSEDASPSSRRLGILCAPKQYAATTIAKAPPPPPRPRPLKDAAARRRVPQVVAPIPAGAPCSPSSPSIIRSPSLLVPSFAGSPTRMERPQLPITSIMLPSSSGLQQQPQTPTCAQPPVPSPKARRPPQAVPISWGLPGALSPKASSSTAMPSQARVAQDVADHPSPAQVVKARGPAASTVAPVARQARRDADTKNDEDGDDEEPRRSLWAAFAEANDLSSQTAYGTTLVPRDGMAPQLQVSMPHGFSAMAVPCAGAQFTLDDPLKGLQVASPVVGQCSPVGCSVLEGPAAAKIVLPATFAASCLAAQGAT